MIIVSNGVLNREFLESAALQNVRAFLRTAHSERGIKGRSQADILGQLTETDLQMTVQQFRTACWNLMGEEFKGNHHVALSALGPFLSDPNRADLGRKHEQTQSLIASQQEVSTNQIIDSTMNTESETLKLLYVGEAEAEVYDSDQSYEDEINDQAYSFKAYKLLNVPVFSQVEVGLFMPYATITTRAIHQKVRPTHQIEAVRERIASELGSPLPPLGNIASGITALWGTHITPRKVSQQEPDGTVVDLTRAMGQRNPSSRNVEDLVRQWEFKHGALHFDDQAQQAPFYVDAGRAIFSFGTRVTREVADHVISAILSAAP